MSKEDLNSNDGSNVNPSASDWIEENAWRAEYDEEEPKKTEAEKTEAEKTEAEKESEIESV